MQSRLRVRKSSCQCERRASSGIGFTKRHEARDPECSRLVTIRTANYQIAAVMQLFRAENEQTLDGKSFARVLSGKIENTRATLRESVSTA